MVHGWQDVVAWAVVAVLCVAVALFICGYGILLRQAWRSPSRKEMLKRVLLV